MDIMTWIFLFGAAIVLGVGFWIISGSSGKTGVGIMRIIPNSTLLNIQRLPRQETYPRVSAKICIPIEKMTEQWNTMFSGI